MTPVCCKSSKLRGLITCALELMLGVGALSMIRDWTPPSARNSAAERPVGPAPTIKGACSMIASHLQIASLVNDRSHEMFASSSSKILEGKRHEMFKSRLQSRHSD